MTQVTEEKVCQTCGGTGKIVIDEFTHRMCTCLYVRKMRAHLGPDLITAKPVFDGPLFQQVYDPEQGNLPTVDLTPKNLFIKSWWNDLRGHLKWAFFCKGPLYYFHIVTDERIRNVFVGNEQYTTKSRKTRDDVQSNNSLHDLIGETYDLVVIRLGFLGYKNVAMAGALLEALRIREAMVKPTWIIEEPNSVFGPGHFSFSEELAEYITHRYEVVDLVVDKDRKAEPRGVEGVSMDDEPGMVLEDDRPKPVEPVQQPQERFRAEPKAEGGLDLDGAVWGNSGSKKRFGKKRSGGGGPV